MRLPLAWVFGLACVAGCQFSVRPLDPQSSDDGGAPPDLAQPPRDFAGLDLFGIDFVQVLPDFTVPPVADLTMPPPDMTIGPTCSNGKKDGTETDKDCGGICTPCGFGLMCLLNSDCDKGICDKMKCRPPTSCQEMHAAQPGFPDGTYSIDPDGAGGNPSFDAFCDMTTDGGGWSLVVNQFKAGALPDMTGDVNPQNFGTTNLSYRVGSPKIAGIAPQVAWKLTDDTNVVYLKPTCHVDWKTDYTGTVQPNDCTTGFHEITFQTTYQQGCYPAWVRGIGINNCAKDCSIRAYATFQPINDVVAGNACACDYTIDQRVSLWFK